MNDAIFNNLDWRQFELLCGSLLAVEGNVNVRTHVKPGQVTHGVDLIFESPDGLKVVAQVNFRRRVVSRMELERILVDLRNGYEFFDADRAFLMFSCLLPQEQQTALREGALIPLEVWDARQINRLLDKHKSVRRQFESLLEKR